MNTIPEEFSARPGRQYPFSQPGDWVMLADISPNARLLYWSLCMHTSAGRGWECHPKQIDLAAMLGASERSVRRWTAELEGVGAVDVEEIRDPARKTRRLVYTVHQTPPEGYEGHAGLRDWYAARRDTGTVAAALSTEHRTRVSGGSGTTGHGRPVTTGHGRPHTTGHPCPGNKTGVNKTDKKYEASPATSDPSPEYGPDEMVCVESAMKILRESVPAELARRMNLDEQRQVIATVAASLEKGHPHQLIRDRIAGCVNGGTIDVYGAIMRRIESLPHEPAATKPAGSAPRRTCWAGCVDGQQVCSVQCPDTCRADHEPVGPPCRSCGGRAPTTPEV